MSSKKEYKKSIEDEIDWKIIDQLHAATLNFSTTSLEIKKLFFVLIGIAVPSLIKLAGDKLDLSLFITIYILAISFWLLDSFTFFYQEKLREKMDTHFKQLKLRNEDLSISDDKKEEDFTLENDRTSTNRLLRSLNKSKMFYLLVGCLNTLPFFLYLIGYIK